MTTRSLHTEKADEEEELKSAPAIQKGIANEFTEKEKQIITKG